MKGYIKNNLFLVLICIAYVFFNNFIKFHNITISIFLAPFLLYYLYTKKELFSVFLILIILFIWSLYPLYLGVDIQSFLISFTVAITVIVFNYSFYYFYKHSNNSEKIFFILTSVHAFFVLTILILKVFNIEIYKVWSYGKIYHKPFFSHRLQLFSLEPSHYSFILVPLFFYFLYSVFLNFSKLNVLLLLTLLLSLMFSMSLGVTICMALSLFVILLSNFKFFYNYFISKNIIILTLIFVLIVFCIYINIDAIHSPSFYKRIVLTLQGKELSGYERYNNSFKIAWTTLKLKSQMWGVGLGQIKILGFKCNDYYIQHKVYFENSSYRIPNSSAETLAYFGIIGFITRIALQIYLFVKCKVHQDFFRSSLFVFIFIYQFTGSYIFNTYEYIIWTICFVPMFNQFSKKNYIS